MIADINIHDYYLQFILNAKTDVSKYTIKLKEVKSKKDELYSFINNNLDRIKELFHIGVTSYEEWTNKNYVSSENLYTKCFKVYNKLDNKDNNRYILLKVITYCNILRNEFNYNKCLDIANKNKTIKFSVYRKIVANYYNKVHKVVLEGKGYKFTHGIGTYCINLWKMDKEKMKNKVHLDYAATNAKKKELLEKGIKLYNDREAAWYKARNIPYDGVDYRVWREDDSFYEITFVKSDLFTSSTLEYKHTEYVVNKYRGMSYMEMADKLCNNIDDICNLQVDIKYKLNIFLYKYPYKYINYIRNAEQCKYKRGAHNS